ncbi:MAG: ead/Ea22-like family protein, partial [Citrobacter sp.]
MSTQPKYGKLSPEQQAIADELFGGMPISKPERPAMTNPQITGTGRPMSNINKQALREAAQEEIMLRSISDTSDSWQDEASPEAVLALLNELEVSQKLATQQGNIAVELFDEVTRLQRSADDKAPELREQLESAEKRIAELEAKLSNPVLLPKTNGYWNEKEKAH